MREGQRVQAPRPVTLPDGELRLHGRIMPASNATFVGEIDGVRVVYKPVAGERPLWDFPDGTLADRELAAYVVSETLGWNVVPETWLRDGPHGPGMVQRWQEPDDEQAAVTLVPAGAVPKESGARGLRRRILSSWPAALTCSSSAAAADARCRRTSLSARTAATGCASARRSSSAAARRSRPSRPAVRLTHTASRLTRPDALVAARALRREELGGRELGAVEVRPRVRVPARLQGLGRGIS